MAVVLGVELWLTSELVVVVDSNAVPGPSSSREVPPVSANTRLDSGNIEENRGVSGRK